MLCFKGKQIKCKFIEEVKVLHEKDTEFAGIVKTPNPFDANMCVSYIVYSCHVKSLVSNVLVASVSNDGKSFSITNVLMAWKSSNW